MAALPFKSRSWTKILRWKITLISKRMLSRSNQPMWAKKTSRSKSILTEKARESQPSPVRNKLHPRASRTLRALKALIPKERAVKKVEHPLWLEIPESQVKKVRATRWTSLQWSNHLKLRAFRMRCAQLLFKSWMTKSRTPILMKTPSRFCPRRWLTKTCLKVARSNRARILKTKRVWSLISILKPWAR